jgi:peptidoglycan/LPS O-acetylase OafA/YrhL
LATEIPAESRTRVGPPTKSGAAGDFRPDINGLRAWAVAAVVLYHFHFPGFGGGFVGVDVFFVISGFLMTGIIVRGLEAAHVGRPYSIPDFYFARARRILPALAVVSAAVLAVGWSLQPAIDYQQLGQRAVAAVTFTSNFLFWMEADYFDLASREKWLLHTWSLSLEWQFYLLYPLILAAIWRFAPSRHAVLIALPILAAVSFLASVVITRTQPSAAFYLLPTRAWELLAGGLVALAPLKRASSSTRLALESAGIALIAFAVLFFNDLTPWPGWRALAPTVGALLVILAARERSILTANPVAQWLGNISYSLFLWHWPAAVGLGFVGMAAEPAAEAIVIVVLLGVAHFSWRFIEMPTRHALARRRLAPALAGLAAFAAPGLIAGTWIYFAKGVPGRLDPRIDQIFAEVTNVNPRREECHAEPPHPVPQCHYGGGALGAIVVGDSHAASIIRTVEHAMRRSDRYVLDWTYSTCAVVKGARRRDHEGCRRFVDRVLRRQRTLPPAPMIIVNRTAAAIFGPNDVGRELEFGRPTVYFDKRLEEPTPAFLEMFRRRYVETACQFAARRPTYLMRPIPELGMNVPRTMGKALLFDEPTRISISLDAYHARNAFVWSVQNEARAKCGVQILDPLPYLCHDSRCWGDRDGLPLYFDDDHLSERGAALLEPMFQTVFRQNLSAYAPRGDAAPSSETTPPEPQ